MKHNFLLKDKTLRSLFLPAVQQKAQTLYSYSSCLEVWLHSFTGRLMLASYWKSLRLSLILRELYEDQRRKWYLRCQAYPVHLIPDGHYYNVVCLISRFIIHVINTTLSLEKYGHCQESQDKLNMHLNGISHLWGRI